MSVSPTEGRGLFQWCLLASWSTSLRDSTPELFRRIDSRAEMVGMVRVRLILVGPRKVWLPLAPGCAPLMVGRADEGVVERSVLERRQLPEGRWDGAGEQQARGYCGGEEAIGRKGRVRQKKHLSRCGGDRIDRESKLGG